MFGAPKYAYLAKVNPGLRIPMEGGGHMLCPLQITIEPLLPGSCHKTPQCQSKCKNLVYNKTRSVSLGQNRAGQSISRFLAAGEILLYNHHPWGNGHDHRRTDGGPCPSQNKWGPACWKLYLAKRSVTSNWDARGPMFWCHIWQLFNCLPWEGCDRIRRKQVVRAGERKACGQTWR